MTLHTGDCLDVMPTMAAESIDAIVTDPPYGLSFMAKDWDAPGGIGDYPMRRTKASNTVNTGVSRQGGRQQQGLDFQKRQARDARSYQEGSEAWATAAYRLAKPGAYLLSFGGTRTVHRLVAGIEDAGWIIRDMLVWAYASGFPKSKASLKPAWEPIVMARKPGPLRMLNIDECRIPLPDGDAEFMASRLPAWGKREIWDGPAAINPGHRIATARRNNGTALGLMNDDGWTPTPMETGGDPAGRWPANVLLSEPVFGDEYSRFFLVPKADRADREPVLGGLPLGTGGSMSGPETRPDRPTNHPQRANVHPTVKPVDLMRHLVRLVTPSGGVVLDPFLGSGTTALAAEMEGFEWIGIEREAEYVAIAEARLNGTQQGMAL